MHTFLPLLATLLVARAGWCGEPTGQMLVFGDSITDGSFATKDVGWVRMLGAEHKSLEVVGEGQGGRNTTTALAFLPKIFVNTDYVAPRHFVFGLGINDLKFATSGDGAARVATATANLRTMIDMVRNKWPTIAITICSPINTATMDAGNKPYEQAHLFLEAMAGAYRQLAIEKKTDFINLLGVVPAAQLPDGLHPDSAGHRLMADAIWAGLQDPTPPSGDGGRPAKPAKPRR